MQLPHLLHGKTVVLRTIELDDAARCVAWLHNSETTRYLARQYDNLTLEVELEWLTEMIASETNLVAAICVRELDGTLRHIGNTGFHQIDRAVGHAELGIFIGDHTMHGHGFGQCAIRTAITHAFTAVEQGGLGLYKVWARVYGPNIASRRMCERVGLIQEGVLRGHRMLPEGRVDEHLFAAFAHSWRM